MQVNESSENYLETILMLSKTHPVVRSVDIATELNFKKSSVSVAMKKLREAHHIIVSPEGFITLTETGKEIADRIYERQSDRREFFQIRANIFFSSSAECHNFLFSSSLKLISNICSAPFFPRTVGILRHRSCSPYSPFK